MTDGSRTRDDQNHNLAFYQLNYGHHKLTRNKKMEHPTGLEPVTSALPWPRSETD